MRDDRVERKWLELSESEKPMFIFEDLKIVFDSFSETNYNQLI